MADPFIGEISLFGGNFAPRGWAQCNGQIILINQNSALFSIVGTIYGGDGQNTFALPDMQGRVPVHQGQGPGLSNRPIGQKGGEEVVTLTNVQMPSHGHDVQMPCDSEEATLNSPDGAFPSVLNEDYMSGSANADMGAMVENAVGGGQAHNNVMPVQVVNFIIALTGVYPTSF